MPPTDSKVSRTYVAVQQNQGPSSISRDVQATTLYKVTGDSNKVEEAMRRNNMDNLKILSQGDTYIASAARMDYKNIQQGSPVRFKDETGTMRDGRVTGQTADGCGPGHFDAVLLLGAPGAALLTGVAGGTIGGAMGGVMSNGYGKTGFIVGIVAGLAAAAAMAVEQVRSCKPNPDLLAVSGGTLVTP